MLEDYGINKQIISDIKTGDSNAALSSYINFIIKFSIGILSIAVVASLIFSGIEYIVSETFTKKLAGKERIMRSIGSLILVFSAFIFFNQLNPELLKVRFKPIEMSPDSTPIKSLSDIWDDENFSDLSEDEIKEALGNFENSIFNHKSCSPVDKGLKLKVLKELFPYLKIVKDYKEKGYKTVVVDDFTESGVNNLNDFRIIRYWNQPLSEGGTGELSQEDKTPKTYENCDHIYDEKKATFGYMSGVIPSASVDRDDCVLIEKYLDYVGGIHEKTQDAYMTCIGKNNNSEIQWETYSESFIERINCTQKRKTITDIKTKSCYEKSSGSWVFDIEKK